MQAIPRWARVALAARTLRRVQPLLLVIWPKATRKFQRGVEWAIAEGEQAAAQGKPTPDLKDAGMAAMDVYGSQPMTAVPAGYLAFAASRVSFGAQQLKGSDAQFALEQARWAAYHFEVEHKAKGLERATNAAVWDDYQRLKETADRENWTDRSPVSPEVFGPMWPKGVPENWPASATPSQVAAPRRRPRPDVSALGLPTELIAFLRSDSQLSFDPRAAECGPVTLKPLDFLRIEELSVTTRGTPLERRDPHRGDNGYYALRVVDLVGGCDAYSPEGPLAWLCDFGMFGSWDSDHHTAIAFPKASWAKIVAAPARFLGAQWDLNPRIAKYIEPWKHCEFRR